MGVAFSVALALALALELALTLALALELALSLALASALALTVGIGWLWHEPGCCAKVIDSTHRKTKFLFHFCDTQEIAASRVLLIVTNLHPFHPLWFRLAL